MLYRVSALGGGLYLALDPLDEGLAVLVALLVLADRADLYGGEAVGSLSDLLVVQLIVVRYREHTTVDLALDEPQALPVIGERRVQGPAVRAGGLPNQRLEGVALLLGPLGELLGERPVALSLVPGLTRRAVEDLPHEPNAVLLVPDNVVYGHLVRLSARPRQLLLSPVALRMVFILILLLVFAISYLRPTHILWNVEIHVKIREGVASEPPLKKEFWFGQGL